MDITSNGSRNLGNRRITLFCVSEKHRFCGVTQPEGCSCACHYNAYISPNNDLVGAAYSIYLAAPSVVQVSSDAAEERAKFVELLQAFEPHVNFHGLTAEELYERLRPTIARATDTRSHWSALMTETELGIKA